MVPVDTGKITHLVCSFPKKREITSSFCMSVILPPCLELELTASEYSGHLLFYLTGIS